MITLRRSSSENSDFVTLVKELDAGLAIVDGEDHAFYSQFNRIDSIKYVIIAYENGIPTGCGAIKEYEPGVMEIKRMFVRPEQRRKGIAAKWQLGEIKCHQNEIQRRCAEIREEGEIRSKTHYHCWIQLHMFVVAMQPQ
jgi:GNAT superfamily N-acetyltransferase